MGKNTQQVSCKGADHSTGKNITRRGEKERGNDVNDNAAQQVKSRPTIGSTTMESELGKPADAEDLREPLTTAVVLYLYSTLTLLAGMENL